MRVQLLIAVLGSTVMISACEGSHPTEPARAPIATARWSLVSDARGGAWRVDGQTGQMDYCTVGGDAELRCWPVPVRTVP